MDLLLSVLLTALIVGLLAFVVALLLRTRQGALGYVGAGWLGMGIGAWIFSLFKLTDPLTIRMSDPPVSVPVLATLVGSLIVLLVFSRLPRVRR
jgi:uncharacterized membrane protein YeaQ/YmgE (transglycosylase-associated protein family)